MRLIFTDQSDGKTDCGATDAVTPMSPNISSTEETDKQEKEEVKSSTETLSAQISEKQNDEESKTEDKDSRLSLNGEEKFMTYSRAYETLH